jgi:YD repeat-containing protein
MSVKSKTLLLISILVIQCMSSSSATAQAVTSCPPPPPPANGCLAITLWYFPDPIPFGWWIAPGQTIVSGQGPYSYYIAAFAAGCQIPAAAKCETHQKCPYCGSPISIGDGNTFVEQSDLRIPGLGGGLSLVRTWNSAWPSSQATFQLGIFGANWRSTYEERVFMGLDNYIKYARSDGSFWSFGLSTSGTAAWRVSAPSNVSATLSTDTSVNPYYVLTFQNGEQRRFDKTTGNLIAIVDRNGNTTTVAYDTSGRLSTVTDAASRQLTFTYATTGNLVTSVTSSVGITLSYAYDQQGRVSQITKPDGSTLNFEYDTHSLISSVKDSNGKVLESHTYDSQTRGLTSSRANGVDAVTVSYPNP